jgi:serine-type D-Ala-D-Ala carboxypeptidase (penicillin-binding protein 5/6)
MKLLKLKKDQYLYLVMLSFIFVASTALVLGAKGLTFNERVEKVFAKSERNFSPLPVLAENAGFPVVSAQAALAIDLTSGISLYEKNPDIPLLPASTTKIVTALVSLDTYPLDSVLKVGRMRIEGQQLGLYVGEEMKAEDLLYGLLVYSANDAAEVLAQNYPGGRDAFIVAMNAKAQELSMKSSRFINPTGLDGNTATARDLLRVSEVAMRDPQFAKIVSTKEITIKDVTGKNVYKLKNINELLGVVPGVMGVKTGWTENARENLVTYLERDDHKIMIVILGSQSRFGETKELIDWIFVNYKWLGVQLP